MPSVFFANGEKTKAIEIFGVIVYNHGKSICFGNSEAKEMNRILCSTGALIGRPNGRDFTLLKKCAEMLECDGFEFMMYGSWHGREDEIVAFLVSVGREFPLFHIEKDVGNLISRNSKGDVETAVSLFEGNCALARRIGSEKLVLHLWGGLDSDKDIENNIGVYSRLRGISDTYGLELTVENVVCNRADPMSHLIALAKRYPDILFTFDTKMAQFHRQLELLYKQENEWLLPHISHIHANDYGGGYMDWGNLRTLHIGDGGVDFDEFFAFIGKNGYKGDFTVEATSFNENGDIDIESLNKTFRVIKSAILGMNRVACK